MKNTTLKTIITIATINYSIPAIAEDTTIPDIYNNKELSQALAKCRDVVNKYESRAQSAARFSFWSAFVGATTGLLGSALAGHASTATIAVLSGTAGITNSMQQQLAGIGYDQEGQQRTRNEIVETVGNLVGKYIENDKTDIEKKNIIIKITLACDLYKTTENGTGD